MENNSLRILVHHHSLVCAQKAGNWFQSFYGAWVNQLAENFAHVGVLAETTDYQTEQLDYFVRSRNITVHSIGTRGKQSRTQRSKQIKLLGKGLAKEYDVLIIRGITPRQHEVYQAFDSQQKFFLLVGSLKDNQPAFGISPQQMLVWYLHKVRIFQLRMISREATIFANSPRIVEELKETLDIDAEFIPTNTIGNACFASLSFKGYRNIPELLFCGRVVEDKGIEELLKALAELSQLGRECRLKIVGSVSSAYKDDLEKQISALGITHLVLFVGFVKFGKDLLDYYRFADIYILPSWHEGFPHSIWEAACSCTPIITTKVGGIPGLVSEEEVVFIPARQSGPITQAIMQLLSDPNKSDLLVNNAYHLAKKFSIENCGKILKTKIMTALKNV